MTLIYTSGLELTLYILTCTFHAHMCQHTQNNPMKISVIHVVTTQNKLGSELRFQFSVIHWWVYQLLMGLKVHFALNSLRTTSRIRHNYSKLPPRTVTQI